MDSNTFEDKLCFDGIRYIKLYFKNEEIKLNQVIDCTIQFLNDNISIHIHDGLFSKKIEDNFLYEIMVDKIEIFTTTIDVDKPYDEPKLEKICYDIIDGKISMFNYKISYKEIYMDFIITGKRN